MNIDEYYISDIIDKNNYIERDNQIILKNSNIINTKEILKKFLKKIILFYLVEKKNINVELVIILK